MSQFETDLANVCLAEYARWDNGAGRETEGTDRGAAKDYYLFVKEYWVSIGINNLTGRTIQGGIRPAWSSAFVSYCIKKAGGGTRFRYSQAHCHYIAKAMDAAKNAGSTYGYVAKRSNTYQPKVGDIVCGGREYAKRFDYDKAELIYEADSFYPSHGDIVVDLTPTHAIVIGGNINHNVDRKRLPLNSSGYLKDRIAQGVAYPWIAVLSCRM